MAKKMNHLMSHDDDSDLPPIRSGHVSMTKPVSGNFYYNYRKRQKFGVTKVWRIRFSNILVDKSLANLP